MPGVTLWARRLTVCARPTTVEAASRAFITRPGLRFCGMALLE